MRTRSELNQQAENLETEIRQLEARIAEEKKEAAKVEEIIENSGKKDISRCIYKVSIYQCLESQDVEAKIKCWMILKSQF